MSYVVCDLETSINNDTVGKFGGSPWYPDNFIVQSGWLLKDGYTEIRDYRKEGWEGCTTVINSASLMVGHNFKFDLHYLWRDPEFRDWFWSRNIKVWDTMVAEYILTGQQSKFASLNDCSYKYGGSQKIDVIKAMWDEGVRTEDMNPDLLADYLRGDLKNTEVVYKAQRKLAEERGQLPLIESMMEAMLCTAEMEFNGLRFDKAKAQAAQGPLLEQIAAAEEEVITALLQPDLPYWHINVGSDQQLSAILFGGDFKYDARDFIHGEDGEPQVYKGGAKKGEAKTKWYKRRMALHGVCKPRDSEQRSKNGYYSVGEDVLSKINHPAVSAILRYRGLVKDLNTYYRGYSDMMWPHDNCIHHNLNTTATDTGRLSSSKPNLQNVSGKGAIKGCFPSRYEGGSVLQADYSQLEVVYQAWLTGDEAMSQDIVDGIDFHCKRLAYKTGEDYDYLVHMCKEIEDPAYVKQRKDIKSVSFQKSYGAGIKAVSEATGIARKEVKAIFAAEDEMYSGVVEFNEKAAAEVEDSAVHTPERSYLGYPVRRGTQDSPSRRRYVFTEDDAPQFLKDKGVMVSFSPTKLKNYCVQGGATGDVVPLALGMLVRRFRTDPRLVGNALLINTIHDSVMVDCKESVREYTAQVLKEVMEGVTQEMNKQWGLFFDLPLRVEVEAGPDWGQLKRIL